VIGYKSMEEKMWGMILLIVWFLILMISSGYLFYGNTKYANDVFVFWLYVGCYVGISYWLVDILGGI